MELRRRMGNDSEMLARRYLEQQGYQFLHANFTCKWGEIDLIMQKEQELVFVEVRSRSSKQYGEPSETVNRKKQEKIRKTAQYFLCRNPQLTRCYCRFDVVSIVWTDGRASVEWIADAFW